ncbi:MAG: HEAT repeat domain-containing protein [Pirellulales bacterium]|nr:HEAT repeat domain-containing protein [Pirellulales bacterium]
MSSADCRHLVTLCSALLLAALASGCVGNKFKYTTTGKWPPMREKTPEELMPTAEDRIDQMRALAKQIPKGSAEEQEQFARKIAADLSTEQSPFVRREMYLSLSGVQSLTANSLLYAGLQDADEVIRIACCQAWGQRGGPDAAKVLAETLSSESNLDVRLAAARALGKAKDTGGVQSLGVALEDPNPAVQRRAMESLEQITGEDFGNDVDAWRTFVQGGTPQPRQESIVSRLKRMF